MTEAAITYSVKDHVARITLNRHTINQQLASELADACRRINDDRDIYVATLTGRGEAFCRGLESGQEITESPAAAIAAIECPVVVAVNGDALGAGLEIALSGDIRLASDEACFGLPQVADGLIPGDGGTQRLPRIVGRGKALELLLTAETVNADEALEMGLVSQVVTPDNLEEELEALAENIAAKGPVALRYLKEAVNQGLDMTLEQGLRLESDLYFLLHTTGDRIEGISSFREKRKPQYRGE